MCIMCCKFWVNIFDSEDFQTVFPMIIKIIKEIALHTGWEYLFFKKKKTKERKRKRQVSNTRWARMQLTSHNYSQ